jgi:hypothetical protein
MAEGTQSISSKTLSYRDAFNHFNRNGKSYVKTATWLLNEAELISNKSDSEESGDEENKEKGITMVRSRMYSKLRAQKKRKKSLPPEELDEPIITPSLINLVHPLPPPKDQPTSSKKCGRPPGLFGKIKPDTERKKIAPIVKLMEEFATEFGISVTQLCGRIMEQQNWQQNRSVAEIGKIISKDEFDKLNVKMQLSPPEALYLKEHEMSVGEKPYTNVRLRFKPHGLILPSCHVLRDYLTNNVYYQLISFKNGKRAFLQDIILKTVLRLLMLPELYEIIIKLDPSAFPLIIRWLTGSDGSGGQKTAHQKSRVNVKVSHTHRESAVACCRDIKTADGTLLYRNPLVASPSGMRPWAVVPGKENQEMVTDFSDFMDKESDVCREQIFESVLPNGKPVLFKNIIDRHLIDGKMQELLLGLGGAFCCKCKASFGEAHDKTCVKAGFELSRDVEGLNQIFNDLYDPETHQIAKRPKDYAKRQGLTQKPITTDESVLSASKTLHERMRSEDWFQRVIYRARAKVLKMGPGSRYSVEEKAALELSKKDWIDAVRQDTGMLMDSPCPDGGTTDTGNTAFRFFSPEIVPTLKRLLPDECRDQVVEIHHKFSVLLRVVSSSRPVNVPMLQDFCLVTYLLILELEGLRISESVHDFLGHSFQLILENDGFGLGQVIE